MEELNNQIQTIDYLISELFYKYDNGIISWEYLMHRKNELAQEKRKLMDFRFKLLNNL